MKKIFLLLLILLAGFFGYIAMQPSHYVISRELAINATPETLFPYLNNAKKMESWNPWTKLDPTAKITFSGPEEGVGSKTAWSSGKTLGTGSATVMESVPHSVVKTKLEYTEPQEMSQMAEISLSPAGPSTIVRWTVQGDNVFIGRVFCFFMNMDKIVGNTFEEGLHNLKSMVEGSAVSK